MNYIATTRDWQSRVTGTYSGATVKGLIDRVDREAHPSNRAEIRAAYTSDGTYHGEGRGRLMAAKSEGSGTRGRWLVESYHDRLTEEHTSGDRRRSRSARGRR